MHTSRSGLVGMVAAVGFIAFAAFTGARAQEKTKEMPMQHGQMSGSMMDDCRAMMDARQQMKAEMESAQAKLDGLVEQMNAAEGDAKTQAAAKVIAELVAQRKSMMSRMMAMQPRMMQHMMGHMRMAMREGSETPMECPMMKDRAK